MESATQACALTRTRTSNLLLCEMIPSQLSDMGQSSKLISNTPLATYPTGSQRFEWWGAQLRVKGEPLISSPGIWGM